MPAYDAAVLLISTVDVDPDVISALQEEEFLAIHKCEPVVDQGKEQRFNPSGRNILTVYSPGQLSWNLEASVLYFDGLADYHPGAALSRRLLPCANAAFQRPFQFAAGAVLVYENPRRGQPAGTLPSIAFTIAEVLGSGLDETAYPSTFVVQYTDLATQAAVTITAAAMNAVLSDLFRRTELVTGTVSGSLYNGNPATTGSDVSGPLASTAWTATSEPGAADTTHITSPEFIWEYSAAARPVSYIRIGRPDLACVDVALAAPVTLAAYNYFRAAAADLTAKLTWDWTGDSTARPARLALRYLLGDTTTGITAVATVLTVKCYDDDPNDGGTLLDTFTVPRNEATWALPVEGQVENAVTLNGTNLAPGGDWLTAYVTVELAGVSELIISTFLSGDILTLAGNAIAIPAGTLSQALA